MFSAVERLLTTGRAYLPRPDAHGLVFGCDLSGTAGVYRVDRPDGFPRRLLTGPDRVLPVAGTAHGLLLRYDHDGNELWQLALLAPDGTVRELTTDGRESHRDISLAPDGTHVGCVVNVGGGAPWSIATLRLADGHRSIWPVGAGHWSWLCWSPDGTEAVVALARHSLRNEAYVVRPDGDRRRLLPQSRHIAAVAWTSERMLAVTDLGDDHLHLVELEPGAPHRVRRVLYGAAHDVHTLAVDPCGRAAVFAVNEGHVDGMYVSGFPDGRVRRLPLPAGVLFNDGASEPGDNLAWHPDGTSVFVAWESATRPGDIVEVRIDGDADPVRWTAAGEGAPAGLVEPVEVSFPSFDGLEIPALHYRLPGPSPRPTVVYFHGGPEGQSRAGINPAVAVWTMAGYDVLAPNVRGSTGYGYAYASLDDRERRADSIRDGCAAGRWLRGTGRASALIATGRSYGGFLTLAVLVEEPELWSAGVDVVGMCDLRSFLHNTSVWRRELRIPEYGDPDGAEREVLADLSPLRRADRIRAPLFIVHGRHDARVPVREAEAIHAAVPGSRLLILEDEGHSIGRTANLVRAYHGAVEFVNRCVGAAAGAPAQPAGEARVPAGPA